MPVTREDVYLVYGACLGRHPRDENELKCWLDAADMQALVHGVGFSAEAIALRSGDPMSGAYDETPALRDPVLAVLRKLAPHEVVGARKVRVGRDCDGGYVMVDAFAATRVAYSLGINNEVSWDLQMAERGIDVFQYDHTMDVLLTPHDRFHWFKIGIEGTRSDAPDLSTLDALIDANGHRNERDMVLKCDIEGHEIDMLAGLEPGTLDLFKQIVVEIHELNRMSDAAFLARFEQAVGALTRSHRVVHVHANNCAPTCLVGGVAVPSVLELSLYNMSDDAPLRAGSDIFPSSLDAPCDDRKADRHLGPFVF